MSERRSALGSLVQTPCGPRKSGMPDSVEMPAPVSATMLDAPFTQPCTVSMISFIADDAPLLRRRTLDDLHEGIRSDPFFERGADLFGGNRQIADRSPD